MKRSLKNGIMIGIIVLMIGAIYFTLNMNKTTSNQWVGGNSPSMENGGEPPSMPGNNKNGGTPPEKPSGENSGDTFGDMTPPSMPDENGNNNGTPPEMPSGEAPQGMPGNNQESTSTVTYILLGVETLVISGTLVYLVMSNFNKKTFKETYEDKSKLVLSGLVVIVLTGGLTYLCTTFIGNGNSPSGMPSGGPGGSSSNVTYSAAKEITSDESITSGEYTSTKADENAISVSGKVTAALRGIKVTKSGDSDGGDNTSFYGNNSAILAKDGATVNISKITVSTTASGANGVFSYGGSATTNNSSSDGTTINISGSSITTTGDNAGGIMTTGGGTMNATNLTIKTSGRSSAAIRSDRGGGTVTVTEGTYETNGVGSPSIYSTADITVNDATLTATKSEGVVIEGANSVTLKNCILTDTNNELNGQSTTYKNIFLYQSMSGDAKEGGSSFTAKNSTITTNKGDSFYITNTTATINLENNTIINKDSSGYFLRAQKDSWGNEGSNGGTVTLNMIDQEVSGDIYIDSISTLTMNMKSSSYEGAINKDNIAKSITLKLDSASKIKLTGDSYVTSLEDADTTYSNIDFNGYKLYVNGKAIN